MTDLLSSLDSDEDTDIERDRWNRYLLPDPVTGKKMAWTRATTFAKSLSDTYGLGVWQTRMAVKGLTMRPDLFALAASAPVTDRTTLDSVAESAKQAAGSASGSNLGTALHRFTERIDRGEDIDIPPPWDADVAAYTTTLAAAGVSVVPNLIERIVVVRELGVAGTFDRLVRLADGRLITSDLKTAKDVSYAWLEIAVQLALYAHGDGLYDKRTKTWQPMPAVDQDTALVMHLPVGKARCDLYEVDIAAGWQAAQTCRVVRQWRSRKNLASRLDVLDTPAPDLLSLINTAGSVAALTALWEAHSPKWTDEHTAAARARKKVVAR